MKKRLLFTITAIFFIVAVASLTFAGEWSVKANYTETCSCAIPCGCVLGSPPSKGHCDGNSLMEISEGHFGDIKLDGISVAIVIRLGEWVKFYVSDNATDEQMEAAVKLFKLDAVFGAYIPEAVNVLSIEKAPITVERTDSKIKYTVASSSVEIEMIKGLDGKPVKILNLPMAVLSDHTQYKAIINKFESEKGGFEYTGTNGLTSVFNLSGTSN